MLSVDRYADRRAAGPVQDAGHRLFVGGRRDVVDRHDLAASLIPAAVARIGERQRAEFDWGLSSGLGRLLAAAAVIAAALSLPVALPASPAAAAEGPALCRDPCQTGVCQEVTTDIPDLNGSFVGDNTVTSVRVPTGWYVTLFEHPNYRGACQVFGADDGWLPASIVGDDRASGDGGPRLPATGGGLQDGQIVGVGEVIQDPGGRR